MYIQRSLTLFFTLKICFSIAQPITSWLPINPNKTFQRVSEGWVHKQINTKGMLCEEESANSSHILKFQSQGNVIYYPVTQWWWLVWRKQVQRKKKLNRAPGERENLAPVRLLWSKMQKGWQNWHLLITHRENTAIKSDAFKGFLELLIKCVVYASRIQMKRISS